MEQLKRFLPAVSTLILGIIAFICTDFANLLRNYTEPYHLDKDKIEFLLIVTDFCLKLDVALLIVAVSSLLALSFAAPYLANILAPKHSIEAIVRRITSLQSLTKLDLFGYSLSFLEPLRYYLNETNHPNLEVTIFIPSEQFITGNLLEDKDVASRIFVQKGRVQEWKNLLSDHKLKSVTVLQYDRLPLVYGLIIDETDVYCARYNWTYRKTEHKFHLDKMPRSKRGMLRLKVSDGLVCQLVMDQIYKGLRHASR